VDECAVFVCLFIPLGLKLLPQTGQGTNSIETTRLSAAVGTAKYDGSIEKVVHDFALLDRHTIDLMSYHRGLLVVAIIFCLIGYISIVEVFHVLFLRLKSMQLYNLVQVYL
jgi:hypothetical protein